MVTSNTILTTIKGSALDAFDAYTHIAVGDDNTTPTASDTALGNEVLRKTFEESVKNLGAGTYLFEIRVALTEANGSTIKEIAVFDAASGGNLATRNLTQEVVKTSDKEVVIDVQVTITANNI